MTVLSDSRYAQALSIQVQDTRNGANVERPFLYTHNEFDPDFVEIAEYYTTIAGDRLDRLAYRFSGDSKLWWVLAEVNQITQFPLFIPAGTVLKVPASTVFRRAAGNDR